MGSGQSETKSTQAPGFIPRSGNRFGDPLAMTYPDPDHSMAEQRFITVGMSGASRVLIVAHADRNESIRIISARKTTIRERRHYEEKA